MSITDIIILMIIRSAASADLPGFPCIFGEVLDLEPDARNLPAVLADSESHLGGVAESQGVIIGACYGSLSSGPGGRRAEHVALLAASLSASADLLPGRSSAERNPDGLGT
jgi:hypothetical protein